MATLGDFAFTDLQGRLQPFSAFSGRPALLVNVASRCGFTPQYAGLERLWRQYGEAGLLVVGFPCDQFGHQEPGDEVQIGRFCSLEYDVTFPLSRKILVNGAHADPLWQWLQRCRPGLLGWRRIKWNFTKFLVGGDGSVLRRYAPRTHPERIAADIERCLG